MELEPDPMRASAIPGQILRRNERREVAIYLRGDKLWVADFIDGCGELVDAVMWFRFNCGTRESVHAQCRMIFESAIPLYEQLEKKIEELHRSGSVISLYAQMDKRVEELRASGAAVPLHARVRKRLEQLYRRRAASLGRLSKNFFMTPARGRKRISPTTKESHE